MFLSHGRVGRMMGVGVAALLVLAAGPDWAAADSVATGRPARELVLVDAEGREIGPVVDVYPGEALVVVTGGGQMALVRVTGEAFLGTALALVFTSADCSGDPLLLTFPLPPGLTSPLAESGVDLAGVLHVATGPAAATAIQSALGPGLPLVCQAVGAMILARPTAPVTSLAGFVRPFRAR